MEEVRIDTASLNAKKHMDAVKAENDAKFASSSRVKLQKVLQKKFKTTMIGALSKFEDKFGRLWGHGKATEDLTPEELEWFELWQATRTEVLDNGNNQLRSATDELNRYTVKYDGYTYFASGSDPRIITPHNKEGK